MARDLAGLARGGPLAEHAESVASIAPLDTVGGVTASAGRRRRVGPGHQARSPASAIRLGTSTLRMTSVSSSTPIVSSSASSRNGRSGTIASIANVPASVIPATVIARDACGTATATASRARRRADSARI